MPRWRSALLAPAVDLDRVAHRLERVERQADRQDDAQRRHAVRPVENLGDGARVGVEEVEVLEDRQHADVGDDAHHQEPAFFRLRAPRSRPRGVVDRDREEQDQDVDRDERHVEVAARGEQPRPAKPVRQGEVDRHDHRGRRKSGKLMKEARGRAETPALLGYLVVDEVGVAAEELEGRVAGGAIGVSVVEASGR